MKFHLRLESGKWIGGIACHRSKLAASLRDLHDLATQWGEPVIATRIDRRGDKAGTTYRVTADTVTDVTNGAR